MKGGGVRKTLSSLIIIDRLRSPLLSSLILLRTLHLSHSARLDGRKCSQTQKTGPRFTLRRISCPTLWSLQSGVIEHDGGSLSGLIKLQKLTLFKWAACLTEETRCSLWQCLTRAVRLKTGRTDNLSISFFSQEPLSFFPCSYCLDPILVKGKSTSRRPRYPELK